ncbi:MAG: hypothetical protein LAQ69_08490 [Acidobacteriia bacterium]|nr:hypothetical protein [Terriglobia bacterium]
MPELYQIAGAILRDVSQARFLSDMYSRQISFSYENDSLLRRFPVPRAEIEEVEFNLPFIVTEVKADPNRHQSRNAAIGRIFDDYSLRIVRAGLTPVQKAFEDAAKGLTDQQKDKKIAADRFEKLILSDDYRVTLHGRLLRYLNEETEKLLSKKDDGPFDTGTALDEIGKVIAAVKTEPAVAGFSAQVQDLDAAFKEAGASIAAALTEMAAKVNSAYKKYPDYSVEVDINPQALQGNPAAASYIKVKAVVKNYRWSKVDVDTKDMRNIRTLAPE